MKGNLSSAPSLFSLRCVNARASVPSGSRAHVPVSDLHSSSAGPSSACHPKPAQFFRGRKRRSTLTVSYRILGIAACMSAPYFRCWSRNRKQQYSCACLVWDSCGVHCCSRRSDALAIRSQRKPKYSSRYETILSGNASHQTP